MLRAVFGLAVLSVASVDASSGLTIQVENEGYDNFGLFYVGDTSNPDSQMKSDLLIRVMESDDVLVQDTFFGHVFAIRTTDMRIRLNVIVGQGEGERPFKITFENLSQDDNGALELQQLDNGYAWIDGGQAVSHLTDENHRFTIRSDKKIAIATFVLHHPHNEL
jgi:hypothetical protein